MNALAKILVALLALFAIAEAHAMRWYSPNTGRWFNRDPLGEASGPNTTEFIFNDSINAVDVLGLYYLKPVATPLHTPRLITMFTGKHVKVAPPQGVLTLYVEKCDIVVLFAEGIYSGNYPNGSYEKIPHKIIVPKKGCAYVGVLGCNAQTSNHAIPGANRLFPNELLDSPEYEDELNRLESGFQIAEQRLKDEAEKRAKEMLRKCCAMVNIIVIDELANGNHDTTITTISRTGARTTKTISNVTKQ